MRVKKFSCYHCGAPKVNPYNNPYIVCDYCGFMIDVDYAAGLQVWNHSEEHTNKYMQMKQKFEANSAIYLKQKNKEAYWQEQYNYWDFYYTHYPEYLPPSIPKGEKYKLFIKAAADMAADAMSNTPTQKAEAYNLAYKSLVYYQKGGKNFVNYNSFLKMMETYIELQEQGFRVVYDNPAYKIMNELLPEKFQLKMKLSQIAQVWIPYLEEDNIDDFLQFYQLKQEYVELEEPQRYKFICEDCGKELLVPIGALVCICEHCRHQNILRRKVPCSSCGYENELPENWNNSITCGSCSTQLRVVQPLFG
jgi:DNA-directed RNA polymerase subunit RPC12/RpoP